MLAILHLLGTSVALGVSQWTAEPGRFRAEFDHHVREKKCLPGTVSIL